MNKLPLPSWAMNLAGFGLLIALVLAAFFWQLLMLDRDLQQSTLARSRMIAAIIEENLHNATLASTTVDTVVTTLLRDKARFVEYLNGIDPLQPGELAALAKETGLLGIALVRPDGKVVAGPEKWRSATTACEPASGEVRYDRERHSALLIVPVTDSRLRCIQIGLDAEAIVQLQQKTSLPALLATLSGLPGIHFVRLEPGKATGESVRLLDAKGRYTAETSLATSMGTLVVGLDAASHRNRIAQMRHQFFLFAALLLGLGIFFSWLLYRVQKADLTRTRTFERLLAREHEAAALGRATATIAHEVRNPLNAISMGVQRLRLESPALHPEQRQLIDAMGEAVQRAGTIINELQRFTRTLQPRPAPIIPGQLLKRLLPLYQQRCADQGIEVEIGAGCDTTISADPDLIAELLENLLKNGIEAQPQGGFLRFDLQRAAGGRELTVTSGGMLPSDDQLERMGEPYFTTKTRGTGLGLALCRRIAEAHGGGLHIAADRPRSRLTVRVLLPKAGRTPATMPQPSAKEPLPREYPDC
ncbi:MAG: hypothetical protein LBD10_08855 [Desulfobulbus sp.]|jgi:signal transduction histidine kinase|uniref:sensor histidine kinase n=1 Tax=Desulfobulbus sp. TaxID=895 RepID=UPI00283DF031|nr:ATP-binding protein [Desulfobulbus sp.]MDR2550290.1 hypothetical protein [Desulfobulbus sp.]